MNTFLTILIVIALLAVVGVLFAGLIGLARGGSDATGNPARSNMLMRWRVVLQGIALVLFALLVSLMRHGS